MCVYIRALKLSSRITSFSICYRKVVFDTSLQWLYINCKINTATGRFCKQTNKRKKMLDVVSEYNAIDVFPATPSKVVKKISYAEKNFKFWANDPNIHIFVLFTDYRDVVYYSKKSLKEQTMSSVAQIGKGCQTMKDFCPRNIDWKHVRNKYRQKPDDKFRKNADARLGFRLRNTFLVKAFFTFGLRTVEKGLAHLIQTLNVPVIIYICPRRKPGLSNYKDKYFPYNHLHKYDMSILLPNGVYRIPAGTRYVLFTTQKNFFGLDVIEDGTEIPFRYKDPVKSRVTKIPKLYDRPIKTPCIVDNEEEEEKIPLENAAAETTVFLIPAPPPPSASEQPQQQQQQMSSNQNNVVYDDFHEFFQTEPFENLPQQQQQQIGTISEFLPPLPSHPQEPVPVPIEQQTPIVSNQETVTYFLMPTVNNNNNNASPHIFEKNIIVASTDFLQSYRALMHKEFDRPPFVDLKKKIDRSSYDEQPVDLSMPKNCTDGDLMNVENNIDNLDNILMDLDNLQNINVDALPTDDNLEIEKFISEYLQT